MLRLQKTVKQFDGKLFETRKNCLFKICRNSKKIFCRCEGISKNKTKKGILYFNLLCLVNQTVRIKPL